MLRLINISFHPNLQIHLNYTNQQFALQMGIILIKISEILRTMNSSFMRILFMKLKTNLMIKITIVKNQ
jgi:hypothetical protein